MKLEIPISTGIRQMFYAVSPNETSFETIEEVPNYLIQIIPIFILAFIIEFIYIKITGRGGRYRINDSISSLSAGIMSRLPHLFFRGIEFTGYCWVWENLRVTELPWNKPYTWILCFLGVDFGYYWFHRFGHEVNIMWAAHQTHHSSEEYNLTTALRQSVFQQYTSWFFYLPMALCIPPPIFLVHIQFNLIYQYWIHTQVIDSLGPLEYILNTPKHHRVHHGRSRYCIDSNYGATLIIWDRMFGTFVWEDDTVVYGLVHPVAKWDPFYIQCFNYVYIWQKFCETEWGNKFSVALKGPGWEPGKPRLGDPMDIPEIKAPQPVYDKRHSLWADCYLLFHFALMMSLFQELTIQHKTLPLTTLLYGTAFILFTLYCFGAILEKSRGYALFEIFRCVCAIICLVRYPMSFMPMSKEWLGLYIPAILAASAMLWCFETILGKAKVE